MRETVRNVLASWLLLSRSAAGWNALVHTASSGTTTASTRRASRRSASFLLLRALPKNVRTTEAPAPAAIIADSLQQLYRGGGSDVRGRFVDDGGGGGAASIESLARAIRAAGPAAPLLTPLAAYGLGWALATMMLQEGGSEKDRATTPTLCLGRDPRTHGPRLVDAVRSGAESVPSGHVKVVCTGLATTPACAAFCRSKKCDVAVVCANKVRAKRSEL